MKRENRIQLILIIILVAILPLIVYLKIIPLPKGSIEYLAWPVSNMNFDFFSYYKAQILKIFTALIVVVTAVMKWRKIEWKNYYIFVFIYIICISLSTIFSPFPSLAINGVADRYEGMSVLIAYLVLFFVTANSLKTKKEFKVLIGALIFSSTVVAIIGIFQYFGYDLFRSDFGKKLILSAEYEKYLSKINFRFGKYTIYSTLYNTNFVGSFMEMFFYLGLGFYLYTKDKIKLILFYGYTLLIFSNLIGCRSRAGMVGFIVTLLIFTVLYRKQILKNIKKIGILLISCIIVFIFMNNIADEEGSTLAAKYTNLHTSDLGLRDLYVEENKVYIEHKDIDLIIENIDNKKLKFYDSDNSELKTFVDHGIILINNKKYSKFKFEIKKSAINFIYDDNFEYLLILKDKTFKTVDAHNRVVNIRKVERFKPFDGKEKMGSFRIYNWSRTIPLLKKTMFIGFGPDTFSIVFPQNDYFGKLISYGRKSIIVDKPHNMYLQLAVNTGVISMLNFIVFMVWLFYRFIKLQKKTLYKNENIYGIIFIFTNLAVFSYLISALFNDSLVSVAPIFWVILGLAVISGEVFEKN